MEQLLLVIDLQILFISSLFIGTLLHLLTIWLFPATTHLHLRSFANSLLLFSASIAVLHYYFRIPAFDITPSIISGVLGIILITVAIQLLNHYSNESTVQNNRFIIFYIIPAWGISYLINVFVTIKHVGVSWLTTTPHFTLALLLTASSFGYLQHKQHLLVTGATGSFMMIFAVCITNFIIYGYAIHLICSIMFAIATAMLIDGERNYSFKKHIYTATVSSIAVFMYLFSLKSPFWEMIPVIASSVIMLILYISRGLLLCRKNHFH